MNITFIAFCAPRPKNPTMGLFVHEMAKACADAGHRITVLVPVRVFPDTRLFRTMLDPRRWRQIRRHLRAWVGLWHNARGTLHRDGVRYDYTRYVTMPWTNRANRDADVLVARRQAWLARHVVERRPAVIVGHFLETAPLAVALAAASSARWALYAHEDIDEFTQRFGPTRVCQLCADADAIFANSTRTKNQLHVSLGSRDSIHVAHLGLSEAFLKATPAPAFDGDRFQLIYVSRFTPRKNHAVLVRAIAAWRDADGAIPLKLTLVGDDSPERGPVERLILDLRLGAHVRVVSATTPRIILNALRQSHGFLFPSRFESFGIVGLEAAALGLPIATGPQIGFATELAIDGWHLPTFDVESPPDCLRAIRNMVDRYADCRAEAMALREHVRATYGWANCVSTLLAHLAPPSGRKTVGAAQINPGTP